VKYYVSRQKYWGVDEEDQYCVEIAVGGIDYANPDMLCMIFSEQGEYDDPLEAAKAAISVRDQWKKAAPKLNIRIDYGQTDGNTLPFMDDHSHNEIIQWAKKELEKMPKCDYCGKPYDEGEEWYHEFTDFKFCSEYCADSDYEDCRLDQVYEAEG
jgi:hypothetical protein